MLNTKDIILLKLFLTIDSVSIKRMRTMDVAASSLNNAGNQELNYLVN